MGEDEGECDDVCFSYTGMTLLSTGPKTDACIDCRKAACTKPEAGFQCSVCPKTNYPDSDKTYAQLCECTQKMNQLDPSNAMNCLDGDPVPKYAACIKGA